MSTDSPKLYRDLVELYFAYLAISFKNSVKVKDDISLTKFAHYKRNDTYGYGEAYERIDKIVKQYGNKYITFFAALQSIYKDDKFGGFENNWEEEEWPFCHNLAGVTGNKSFRYIGDGQDGFKEGFQFVFNSQDELVVDDINGGSYDISAPPNSNDTISKLFKAKNHFLSDVKPWIILGNAPVQRESIDGITTTVTGDITTIGERYLAWLKVMYANERLKSRYNLSDFYQQLTSLETNISLIEKCKELLCKIDPLLYTLSEEKDSKRSQAFVLTLYNGYNNYNKHITNNETTSIISSDTISFLTEVQSYIKKGIDNSVKFISEWSDIKSLELCAKEESSNGKAIRYALLNNNPFVIFADDVFYEKYNIQGQLDLFSRTDHGMTDNYIEGRIKFWQHRHTTRERVLLMIS